MLKNTLPQSKTLMTPMTPMTCMTPMTWMCLFLISVENYEKHCCLYLQYFHHIAMIFLPDFLYNSFFFLIFAGQTKNGYGKDKQKGN